MTTAVAVGVDIGGTKIAAGLASHDGLIGEVRTVATGASEGGPAVLQRAIGLAQQVVAGAGSAPIAIGIASGGWIDRSTGRVVSATNLLPGWVGTNLSSEFERAIGLPAVALNDVQAIGLGEAKLGAGRDCEVCLCVAVGTGIGGAITIGSRLLEGAHGMAGAIGHIPFRAGGPRCSCGRRGCIEAFASGPAIARSFARCSGLRSATRLEDAVAALKSPETQLQDCALRVTAAAGVALGRVLGGVSNTIDPDVIVLAGGAALALGDPFLDAVSSGITETVLEPMRPTVVMACLGEAAGVVGAALAALNANDILTS